MKILIERTAERPAARQVERSRAIVQNTTTERLELEIDGPTKAIPLAGQQREPSTAAELTLARQVVRDFLRRTNKRAEADHVADFELAVLERSPANVSIVDDDPIDDCDSDFLD